MKKEVSGKTAAKTAVLLGIVLVSGLWFAGCVTNKGTYDKTVPPEQQATLEFSSAYKVKLFDGNEVSWKAGLFTRWYGQGIGKVVVKIPAGEHTLVADYWVYSESYQGDAILQESQSTSNIAVTFDFQPGRVYKMVPSDSGGLEITEAAAK
jgi:hypothetical protein